MPDESMAEGTGIESIRSMSRQAHQAAENGISMKSSGSSMRKPRIETRLFL